jgi:hypothetical protein
MPIAIMNMMPIWRGAGSRKGKRTAARSETRIAAKKIGGTPPSVTVQRVMTRLSAQNRHTATSRAKSAGFMCGVRESGWRKSLATDAGSR